MESFERLILRALGSFSQKMFFKFPGGAKKGAKPLEETLPPHTENSFRPPPRGWHSHKRSPKIDYKGSSSRGFAFRYIPPSPFSSAQASLILSSSLAPIMQNPCARAQSQAREGSTNSNLWVRLSSRGGGLPREAVGAKRFGMSLETRTSRDLAGISRGCPESLRKILCSIADWNLSSAELESGNAPRAFLQTPAPALDKIPGPMGPWLLSSTRLELGTLIRKTQVSPAPALDKSRWGAWRWASLTRIHRNSHRRSQLDPPVIKQYLFDKNSPNAIRPNIITCLAQIVSDLFQLKVGLPERAQEVFKLPVPTPPPS